MNIYKKFGPDLPFLLKILSIKTSLSIQIHPDKNLAKHLSSTDPSRYLDDNHKPELVTFIAWSRPNKESSKNIDIEYHEN